MIISMDNGGNEIMNIQQVSNNTQSAIVYLTRDELVKICNIMYNADDKYKDSAYYSMMSDLIVARDMCSYGKLDKYTLLKAVGLLDKSNESVNNDIIPPDY